MINQKNAAEITAAKEIKVPNGKNNGLSIASGLARGILEEVVASATYNTKCLFKIQSANGFINESKQRKVPACLFEYCWYENEISILFADSNLGKSILAVQIANDIAKPQKVLLFDFELSGKQFEGRYSDNYTNHYIFPENLLRAEIDPDNDFDGFTSFEDYLIYSLEQTVAQTEIKILIVDNITYLKNETDKAKYALPLMKKLKQLQRKYSLSILVLAHTPKRDMKKAITQNDLQGIKMIMNFCDSAFAIGASHKDPSLRYLKQIKSREVEAQFTSENAKLYQIIKADNFLSMEFMGFSSEREHLRVLSERAKEDIKLQAKELAKHGKSQREIAKELGIGVSTVNKYLKLDSAQSCEQLEHDGNCNQ